VDKTAAVVELATSATKVTLFTRPRRFGKSTLLSTLEAFFQLPQYVGDTGPLFADLAVWRSEEARRHHQRYPVLTLNFKGAQALTWEAAVERLRDELAGAVRRLQLLEHADLAPTLAARLVEMCTPGRGAISLQSGIQLMCEALHTITGQPVVLLIDEYDSPLHSAWQHGYLEEALDLFRALFRLGLKENRHLHKAVITGILRVARESLFSTVNHLRVFSILQDRFADTFGFTQGEVEALAAAAGLEDRLPELEAWYNGYLIGGVRLYNPWSVLSYFEGACDRVPSLTGSTPAARRWRSRCCSTTARGRGPVVEELLRGGACARRSRRA
jgi:hypothetical protein